MTAELTIVIPTFNERANIKLLLEKLDRALAGMSWEVVFVDDDSADGTGEAISEIARQDSRVRCIRRVGRRGLASACMEGLASSSAPYLAVMDADLQHDEAILSQMIAILRSTGVDVCVGSRYIAGGSMGDMGHRRRLMSRLATRAARQLTRCPVADPMSGFFMLRREVFWETARALSGRGFKILLDLLASAPRPLRVHEIPYTFRARFAGESKLDTLVALEYGYLLADKLIGWLLPVRFMLFVLVGGVGAMLHVAILGALNRGAAIDFWLAQTVASVCAMVLNFALNNAFTHRDRRLRGRRALWGLFLFVAICSVGALTNVQVAVYLFKRSVPWWLAGLIGAGIGAVWNYSVSLQLVWRGFGRPARG